MVPTGRFGASALAVLALATTTTLAATAKTTTATTTTSLLLPAITTSADERIYATLISGAEDKDVYSLDCQSDFKASRTCSGAFAGRTLTYGPATVRLDLGGGPLGGVYDCAAGGPASADTGPLTCRVSAGGTAASPGTFTATATLDESLRVTPVTVIGATGKARARTRNPTGSGASATAAAAGVCKRDLHKRKTGSGQTSGGSNADAGTAGTAGTAGANDADDGTTPNPRRTGADGCSAGSRVNGGEWLGGLLGLGALALAFAI